MILHDLITLMILLIGTSGTNEIQYIKYTSEYVSELQIHPHSLLTRKVFSWHNLSARLFLFVSSGSSYLHLQVIFIFKSSSSLDLDHLWIWNINGSRSSLLDHHHRCYLLILLVTGSSTEPTLFHAGCRPSLHVGLLTALISYPKSEWPTHHVYLIMKEPIL